jgi:hypothetical protein
MFGLKNEGLERLENLAPRPPPPKKNLSNLFHRQIARPFLVSKKNNNLNLKCKMMIKMDKYAVVEKAHNKTCENAVYYFSISFRFMLNLSVKDS